MGLLFVMTHLLALCKSTTGMSTKCNRFLGTSSDWSELCDRFLRDRTDFLGPLGTLGAGGISSSLILTLLFIDSLALNYIVINIMCFLFCPTLGLVLSPTDFWSLNITVLYQGSSADLDSLSEGNGFVLDEAALSVVFVTFFLLLRLVVSHISCVTSLVVGVVALNDFISLCVLHHLHLVDASLTSNLPGSSNFREADSCISLSRIYCRETFRSLIVLSMNRMMITVVGSAVMIFSLVKWECVQEGTVLSHFLCIVTQLPLGLSHTHSQNNNNKKFC